MDIYPWRRLRLGSEVADLHWFRSVLENAFLIKTDVLGPDNGQKKQIRMLNRLLTWEDGRGITLEADTRHVETIIGDLKVKDSKPLKPLV